MARGGCGRTRLLRLSHVPALLAAELGNAGMIVVPLIENPNDLREPHLHGAASAGAAAAIPALRDIDL
jgi:hypothetical protein